VDLYEKDAAPALRYQKEVALVPVSLIQSIYDAYAILPRIMHTGTLIENPE
jgi:hypothetical protein